MARPRSDAEGPNARERIIGAFWSMLSEMPYGAIKVVALARRAQVSPNTLYYHFDNVGQIARQALDESLDADLAHAVMAGDVEALRCRGREVEPRFERVLLFARSGSAELTEMLSCALRAYWLVSAGLSEGDLDDAMRRDLTFIFGGVVAMLGDASFGSSSAALASFFDRPLGLGVAATMALLAAR